MPKFVCKQSVDREIEVEARNADEAEQLARDADDTEWKTARGQVDVEEKQEPLAHCHVCGRPAILRFRSLPACGRAVCYEHMPSVEDQLATCE